MDINTPIGFIQLVEACSRFVTTEQINKAQVSVCNGLFRTSTQSFITFQSLIRRFNTTNTLITKTAKT